MKKTTLALLLTSAFLLTACSNQNQSANSSSSSKETSSSSQTKLSPEQEKFQKEVKEVTENPNVNFPQLSTEVAADEAEVNIVTSKGNIRMKLFPKYAPLAVENFLTHAKEGYYNGLLFHRVIKDFMIQTGDPKGDGTGGESIWNGKDPSKDLGTGFKNEPTAYLYNLRGAVAMANAGAGTNGSQFFINQNTKDQSAVLNGYPEKIKEAFKKGGNPSLAFDYTVFGQVLEGMDVVDAIASVETENDKPKEDIKIEKIDIIKDYDFKK